MIYDSLTPTLTKLPFERIVRFPFLFFMLLCFLSKSLAGLDSELYSPAEWR